MNKYSHIYFETIDSTNEYLKREYRSLSSYTFISASTQTNGRGRLGRKWLDEGGKNILFSLLIKDEKLCKNFTSLSILAAVSVLKSLKSYNIDCTIKWPNDVFVNDKKLAGILLEGISEEGKLTGLIIGVGINVYQKQFLSDYRIDPTSVVLETNSCVDIENLRHEIFETLISDIDLLEKGHNDYLFIARENNYLLNKKGYATINNEEKLVTVLDINDDNTLRVSYENNIYNLLSGEINLKS